MKVMIALVVAAEQFSQHVTHFDYAQCEPLFFGWRNREGVLCGIDPFIPFVDQHHGDVVHDRIFAATILTDKPGIFVQNKHAAFLADAVGAS